MFNLFKKDEEYNYFKALTKISLQTVEITELLSINLKNDRYDTLDEALKEIQKIDKLVNHLKKELLNYLYKDFLPPIERKDIIALTYVLDNVLKKMMDLMIHLDIYQIKKTQPTMRELMKLIGQSINAVPQLMEYLEDFKHPQKIKETLEEMNEINNQGVKLYQQALKNLYLEEVNAIDTIKYSKIYEHFNEVFRSIERLMNAVAAVIIENT